MAWGYFAAGDGDQLSKALEVLSEMKVWGLRPNTITYSILSVASERKDDLEAGLMILSQAKKDCVAPTLLMGKCIISMLNGIEFLLYFTRNICTFPRLIVPELIQYLVNIYEFSGTEIPWR
ncbi:hypothetical protein NC651_009792 [Populus alba x Populus x berolinensis]|nr:hypothetical protein NC651_009792 [Populus alba x Populus x berolinensis]